VPQFARCASAIMYRLSSACGTARLARPSVVALRHRTGRSPSVRVRSRGPSDLRVRLALA